MTKHDQKPELTDLPEDVKLQLEQLYGSGYFKHVERLKKKVVGKTVVASSAGGI